MGKNNFGFKSGPYEAPYKGGLLWLLGGILAAQTVMLLAAAMVRHNLRFFGFSFFSAVLSYLVLTDERITNGPVVSCIGYGIVAGIAGVWVGRAVWEAVVLSVATVGILCVLFYRGRHWFRSLRRWSGRVYRPNDCILQKLYFSLVLSLYPAVGWGTKLTPVVLNGLLFSVGILLALQTVYFWNWWIAFDRETWTVHRLGRDKTYQFWEITGVRRLGLGRIAILTGNRVACIYRTYDTAAISFGAVIAKKNKLREKPERT